MFGAADMKGGNFSIGFLFILTSVGAAISFLAAGLVRASLGNLKDHGVIIPIFAFAPLALLAVVSSASWVAHRFTKRSSE
ncbi:MAG: hypothetical protein R3C03_20980 [Pirellulaceae bacterium]